MPCPIMWATFAMLTDSSARSIKRGLLQFAFWQNPPHCAQSWREMLSGTDFLVLDIKQAAESCVPKA